MFRRFGGREFLHQPRHDNPHLPAGLHQPGQVILHVKIVRPEVMVRIHAHDGVEKPVGEWQGMGLSVDGKHPVLDTRFAESAKILAGIYPQVRRPHLRPVLLRQEYRAQSLPQPRSSTRIPEWNLMHPASDSVSHRAFGPIMFSSTQSGS